MIRIYIAIILFFLTGSVAGQIHLPAIISDNMILQQKADALLWGTASKNSRISISMGWNKHQYTTATDSEGNWKIKVPTPQAGGPYQIIFKTDKDSITIKNILIGEVWVCSGQSNMEMPLKGYRKQPVLNAEEIISDADNHPDIHVFRVPKVVSSVPLEDCEGKWYETNSTTAPDFSAVAYQYAKILNDKLHVPVGIIATYWGGTAIQSWMSEKNLSQFPEAWLSTRLDTITNPEKDPEKSPAILLNSMIMPVASYTIKGFIWYQGESNRFNPLFYRKLMPAMVKEWRGLWESGNLPFYYVQIAPYGYWDPKHEQFSAVLRESQLKAMKEIPNSGMVVSLDAGKEKFIHPPDKTIVSKRLSYWALGKTYHQEGISYAGPVFKKMKIRGGKAYLCFDNADRELVLKNGESENFEIAGSDRIFYKAKAKIINKNRIEVQSEKVKKPVAVRYAFKNWVIGDLYNKEGLPASSFRTDDWDNFKYKN